MGARQRRQRPRSRAQLTSGMLSRGAIALPHEGQREAGRTSDSLRGTRWITTFANDPNTRPSRPASMAAASGLMHRSLPAGASGVASPSTGRGLAGGTWRLLLPRLLLQRRLAEADRVGDARRVAHVQVVLGVDGVAVDGAVVAAVAARPVAVVHEHDAAVVAVEQDGHLGPELDLVAAVDRRAVADAAGARVPRVGADHHERRAGRGPRRRWGGRRAG